MSTALGNSPFDRISALLEEIDQEKTASDSAGAGGSSHPTETSGPDDGNQPADDNADAVGDDKDVKDNVPNSVNATPEATGSNAPKDEDAQPAGMNDATPVGESPEVEKDYGSKVKDPGTSHPASMDNADKYAHISDEQLASIDTDTLYKLAADVGNDLLADIANGLIDGSTPVKQSMHMQYRCNDCKDTFDSPVCPKCGKHLDHQKDASAVEKAAEDGYTDAAGAEALENAVAAQVVQDAIKQAEFQADLVAAHLTQMRQSLEKTAMEVAEDADPAAADHPDGDIPPELVEALAGTAGDVPDDGDAPGGGAPDGDIPPELVEALAAQTGDHPADGGAPAGQEEPLPESLDDVDDDEALQELNMALMEQGIDPAELAAAASNDGVEPLEAEALEKTAAAAIDFKRSGRFVIREAKTARERRVRDLMKGYISELLQRSQR